MIKKILLFAPTAVGDLVIAQSLMLLLKAKNPNVVIDLLSAGQAKDLSARIPEIRRVIYAPFAHNKLSLFLRYRLGKSLRAENYDQVIVFSRSFKSALLPWFTKIPIRTGWRGEWRYGLLNDIRVLPGPRYSRMIRRFLALGSEPGESLNEEAYWPKLTTDKNLVSQALVKFQLVNDNKPILALCPGAAGGPAKRWPETYFSQVAEYFQQRGWSVWCIGGPAEKEIIARINASLSKPTIDLSSTTLSEAIDLLSLTTVVVANDSGLMHIASALRKPVVAIYGSTSSEYTPPLTQKARILSKALPCKPCFKSTCRFGHYNCLKQISVDEVINAIYTLEGENKNSPVR